MKQRAIVFFLRTSSAVALLDWYGVHTYHTWGAGSAQTNETCTSFSQCCKASWTCSFDQLRFPALLIGFLRKG